MTVKFVKADTAVKSNLTLLLAKKIAEQICRNEKLA